MEIEKVKGSTVGTLKYITENINRQQENVTPMRVMGQCFTQGHLNKEAGNRQQLPTTV